MFLCSRRLKIVTQFQSSSSSSSSVQQYTLKVEISKPGLIVGKVGDIRVIDCQKSLVQKEEKKEKM